MGSAANFAMNERAKLEAHLCVGLGLLRQERRCPFLLNVPYPTLSLRPLVDKQDVYRSWHFPTIPLNLAIRKIQVATVSRGLYHLLAIVRVRAKGTELTSRKKDFWLIAIPRGTRGTRNRHIDLPAPDAALATLGFRDWISNNRARSCDQHDSKPRHGFSCPIGLDPMLRGSFPVWMP